MGYTSLLLSLLTVMSGNLLTAQEPPQEEPIYSEEIRPVHVEKLEYRPLARQARVQGVVVVRAKLDDQGNVISSAAISGHKLLIPEALENAKKWKFLPNAKSEVIIVYNFGIDEGLCDFYDLPCSSYFTFRPPNLAIVRSSGMVAQPNRQPTASD